MRRAVTVLAIALLSAIVIACKDGATRGRSSDAAADSAAPDAVAADGAAPITAAYAERARQIASEYVAWGRVDDELRWAPFLCRIPLPGIAWQSESKDPSTHGQKLYSVFVKHRDNYPDGPHDGQVVVKESWRSERVTTPDASFDPGSSPQQFDAGDHFYAYARGEDGAIYRASERAGLYLMWKIDAQDTQQAQDTDDGWVYATVLPSGEVTAAGRISSCMGCHEIAPHDRLFGVPKSPTTFR